ncbi:hypothetical protein SPF06_00570 [Sinomonas sp. JGH33]|uniref:Co/Zn/Cd efflux system component n=1 Tax=Sinomonas terricola TaxID=3110330 RepID=A0ABU5T0M2_9MICC|nr:hypothetical protein [Sinomonas sp. JGH33]MEA5453202.1 hypothetical protein [Sinomonas sp. JGH33]
MAMARTVRRTLTVLVALVLAGLGVYIASIVLNRNDAPVVEGCTALLDGQKVSLATDQAANASLITAIAVRRGLPARAATIAIATSMQEAKLRNINYGDHAGPDSRGLFQQRTSQGWGTESQLMDPVYATNAFYDALVKVPGYESLSITDAAQRVQRSAYPEAYSQHEDLGRGFASALTGNSHASLDCTLRKPDAAGDPAAVRAALNQAYGTMPPLVVAGGTVTAQADGPFAWSLAQWAVANAKGLAVTRVEVDGQAWTRDGNKGWADAQTQPGVVVIRLAPGQ